MGKSFSYPISSQNPADLNIYSLSVNGKGGRLGPKLNFCLRHTLHISTNNNQCVDGFMNIFINALIIFVLIIIFALIKMI